MVDSCLIIVVRSIIKNIITSLLKMLLCFICNEKIFDNDEKKCSNCKVLLHFACAGIREAKKLKKEIKEQNKHLKERNQN